MEAARRKRTTSRTVFTRAVNDLAAILTDTATRPVNKEEVIVYLQVLEERHEKLREANEALMTCMHEGVTEEAIATEDDNNDEYERKFLRTRLAARNALGTPVMVTTNANGRVTNGADAHIQARAPALTNQIKLPKIELKKYDGDIKEWLRFWSQFKKIHENTTLDKETKFEYLLQAMIPGSRAAELADSFPPTGENYDKVIAAIKNRFGRDEMLVEVYVRELLKLILQNAMKPNEKIRLASLFDKIESQLRVLESLGVITDRCSAMLYLLVESSLPEELLRTWNQGTPFASQYMGEPPSGEDRLTRLMKFLQSEIENEERITIAVSGFDINERKQSKQKQRSESTKETPSAMSLHATGKVTKPAVCVFCENEHASAKCEKARKMPLSDKRSVLQTKNACFNCLKIGHQSRVCRCSLKCALCSRRHVVFMCPELVGDRGVASSPKTDEGDVKEEKSLLSHTKGPEVILQTLRGIIRNKQEEHMVRVFFDSGSTKSYVCKDLIRVMGYEPIGKLKLKHSLFGNVTTQVKEHKRYLVHMGSFDGKYNCNFQAYDEDEICADVPLWPKRPWMNELRELSIPLTDGPDKDDHAQPIKILIGADIAGKLMTGRTKQLRCGLTAIETHLGWTLMGKVPNYVEDKLAVQTISMLQQETCISNLWSLDVVGINDPVIEKSRKDYDAQVRERFIETVKTNDEERYEVCLPWIESHPALPTNYDIAVRRLIANPKRLKAAGMYDYDRVLQDWREQGIIEEVIAGETNIKGHYLSHRGIVKEGSSTPLRPVFDTSAKGKDSPSLNECLEKRPNLIELISSILLRFRKGKFGIVADIEKAFLQICLNKNERDYLRFLWYDEIGNIITYRHARVVFGVTCSPFLLGAVIELHLSKLMTDEKHESNMMNARDNICKLLESFYVDNCIASLSTKKEIDEFMYDASYAMRQGAFHLRGWEHTSAESGVEEISVLGMIWNKHYDSLRLVGPPVESALNERVTKRTVLSYAHRVFDPLGFVCPVMICPKLILQKAWIAKVKWDEELNEEMQDEFKKWLKGLLSISKVHFPQWAFHSTDPKANVTFHMFCDASKSAYAAVLYARTEYNSEVIVTLITAKARVAPVSPVTIPRLELLAACTGARLAVSSLYSLRMEEREITYWCDSTTVLFWIQRNGPWASFVES